MKFIYQDLCSNHVLFTFTTLFLRFCSSAPMNSASGALLILSSIGGRKIWSGPSTKFLKISLSFWINVGTDGHVIDDDASIVRIEVPMHLRYRRPVRKDGKSYESVNRLTATFFAILNDSTSFHIFTPSLPSRILSALPSSKVNSILISILPRFNSSDSAQSILTLLLGNSWDLSVVEPLTALVIIACFLWLLRVSFRVAACINMTHKAKTV
ncbi:hypothetical protein BDN70DRAFT_518673 [Pholiota conissans]|uniref:Protein PBN1 n=1 Tax=Pholiota conissans TaxID=109636 RepID=A0A9P5Z573_9AGAR|nr:hypothetical protein BDN70DRAFT_518673 [Pholiota conissans]